MTAEALPSGTPRRQYYYVDEAGDLTLFDRKGRVIVGKPGVSTVFMLGIVDLPNPSAAREQLEQLRSNLLADPYFSNVPSMRPETKKTAMTFHATDDVPEVRREMFRLLLGLGIKVQVAIRRKDILVREAQALYRIKDSRLSEHAVYDSLVRRLFKNVLHKADENHVVFARRGTY